MIVTVNLTMKSGAALTVYHEPKSDKSIDIFEELNPSGARDAGHLMWFQFFRDKGKKGFTSVLMNEVAVIEIFREDNQ